MNVAAGGEGQTAPGHEEPKTRREVFTLVVQQMFCFSVYMTNFCMEVFNCETSVIARCQSISKLAYLVLLFCALSSLLSMYTVLQPVYILFSFHSFSLNCNSLPTGHTGYNILKTLSVLSTNRGTEGTV